jgi:hypothetical protein
MVKPRDHIHNRRFAGAIGSDNRKDLTLLNVEAHVSIGLNATETLRDILNAKHCC